MIYIFKADSFVVRQQKSLNELLQDLPEAMQERALRYRFEQDAYNFVLGRVLLKQGLGILDMNQRIEEIMVQPDGKPFLVGVYFNISHSENLVVCSVSTKGAIGIDVEKIKPVVLENFKAWFTEREWADITLAADSLHKFYWYWTRKESILKALGMKLSDLNRIDLDATQDFFIHNGDTFHLKELGLSDGFYGALCSELPIDELHIFHCKSF